MRIMEHCASRLLSRHCHLFLFAGEFLFLCEMAFAGAFRVSLVVCCGGGQFECSAARQRNVLWRSTASAMLTEVRGSQEILLRHHEKRTSGEHSSIQ